MALFQNITFEEASFPPPGWTLSNFFPTGATYARVPDPLGQEGNVLRLRCVNSSPTLPTDYSSAALQQAAMDIGTSGAHALRGNNTWYRYKIMFPTGNVFCNGTSNFLVEWHVNETGPLSPGLFAYGSYPLTSQGTTHPKLVFVMRSGNISAPTEVYWPGGGTGQTGLNNAEALAAPLLTNHWYDIVFHIIWSENPSVGLFEWWIDGTLIVSQNQATYYTVASETLTNAVYNYRYNVLGDSSIYYALIQIADSAADIGGVPSGGGGGTTNAKILTLEDSFDDNAFDPSMWTKFDPTGGTTSEVNQRVQFALAANTITPVYGEYSSLRAYDLTGSSVFARMAQQPTGGGMEMSMQVGPSTDRNNCYEFSKTTDSSQLVCSIWVNAVRTIIATPVYDSTTMAYQRIRESGGTVFWETSPDGRTWTVRAQRATGDFAITDCFLSIYAGSYSSTNLAATAAWDSVNTPAPITTGGANNSSVPSSPDTYPGIVYPNELTSPGSNLSIVGADFGVGTEGAPVVTSTTSKAGSDSAVGIDTVLSRKLASREFAVGIDTVFSLVKPGVTGGVARAISLATYKVEVAWELIAPGLFTLGTSTLGGSDVLASSPFANAFSFAGPLDNISADVMTIEITRGRSNDLSSVEEGRIVVTLQDPAGKYNPNNPLSPLAGQLRVNRPLRFTATFQGIEYGRFFGWIRRISYEPSGRGGTATIEASDILFKLGDAKFTPTIPSTGQTVTGTAIGKILDALGWTDATMREIGVGDPIIDFSASADKIGLQLIQDLLQTEGGIVYQTGSGKVRYRDRSSRYPPASAGSLVNRMIRLNTGVSLDDITNEWGVARESGGTAGTPIVVSDSPSIFLYGERRQDITSPYLLNDSQAQGVASYLVSRTRDPVSPLWAVTMENRDDATMVEMLARDLGDRETIVEAENGTSGDFIIESIRESLDFTQSRRHTVAWAVTRLPIQGNPFRLGTSTLEGSDVLVY